MKTILPPVILVCGGLGTRLKDLTQNIPKSLIEIHGTPFIEYQMRLLKKKGANSVIICAGHLSEQIVEYIGNGEKYGLGINYALEDPNQLLGVGGAINNALELVEGDSFYTLYGDSYLDIDYAAVWSFFRDGGKKGLMTVMKNNNNWDQSNVDYREGKIIAYDKKNASGTMQYIDYGLSMFDKAAFSGHKSGEKFDLSLIHQNLIKENELAGFEVFDRFYEIGSIKGIGEFEEFITT